MPMGIIQLCLTVMVAGKSQINVKETYTDTLTRTSKELRVKSRLNKLLKVHLTKLNKNGLKLLVLVSTPDSPRQLMLVHVLW